jgi:hypothetical protein
MQLLKKPKLNNCPIGVKSGANTTTLSYNASAVKNYNGANSIARFSNFFLPTLKSFPAFYNALAL